MFNYFFLKMDICQISNKTSHMRYPAIFRQSKRLLAPDARVLSFGCSSGEEVRTLQELNPQWVVHGADVHAESLRRARAADPEGVYVSDARTLEPGSYDAIFCMSVLCLNSRRKSIQGRILPLTVFISSLREIARLLAPQGILVLFNAQYDVRHVLEVRHCFEAIPIPIHGGSGFIPKFHSDGMTQMHPAYARDAPHFYRLISGSLQEDSLQED
jgi:SAM-dependent methyltransferase